MHDANVEKARRLTELAKAEKDPARKAYFNAHAAFAIGYMIREALAGTVPATANHN